VRVRVRVNVRVNVSVMVCLVVYSIYSVSFTYIDLLGDLLGTVMVSSPEHPADLEIAVKLQFYVDQNCMHNHHLLK